MLALLSQRSFGMPETSNVEPRAVDSAGFGPSTSRRSFGMLSPKQGDEIPGPFRRPYGMPDQLDSSPPKNNFNLSVNSDSSESDMVIIILFFLTINFF